MGKHDIKGSRHRQKIERYDLFLAPQALSHAPADIVPKPFLIADILKDLIVIIILL